METATATKTYRVLGETEDVTTCECCGRSDLKKTVVLVQLDANGNADGGPVYMGTSCGAQAAGWTQREVTRRVAVAVQQASVNAERRNRYAAALADYRAKGSAIVREGEQADFNVLRGEHCQRDETLRPPAAFAAWLEARIAELEA